MLPRIVFFGTPEYSLIILGALHAAGYPIAVVVTKPDRVVGRKQELIPTAVKIWAQKQQIPFLTPASHPETPHIFHDEPTLIAEILSYKPELCIVADYSQMIPQALIKELKYGGLNVHPSLLPSYKGPAPVPWALVNGETETGVSITTLAEVFDEGQIVAQHTESILATDTTHTLLTRLFEKGADLLVKTLPEYIQQYPNLITHNPQLRPKDDQPLAETTNNQSSRHPRLTRDDGFIPWELVKLALAGETVPLATIKQFNNVTILKSAIQKQQPTVNPALLIDRAYRGLHPWPGVWTKIQTKGEEKRLKLLKLHVNAHKTLVLDEVQLEGKTPTSFTSLHRFIT